MKLVKQIIDGRLRCLSDVILYSRKEKKSKERSFELEVKESRYLGIEYIEDLGEGTNASHLRRSGKTSRVGRSSPEVADAQT